MRLKLSRVILFSTVLALLLLAGIHPSRAGGCTAIRNRKEWRQLTPSEQSAFLKAVKSLATTNATKTYNWFPQTHYDQSSYIHGYANFLPWHRKFLREFEASLRVLDASVALPYWDWSLDSQAPELAPVWSNTAFGGNGDYYTDVVKNGVFANWVVSTGGSHKLQREWDLGSEMSAFYSPETLNTLMVQATTYSTWKRALEVSEANEASWKTLLSRSPLVTKSQKSLPSNSKYTPHGQVHNNIGGDMAQMYSPNDPIFFLHHAFLDKLWWQWQQLSSSRFQSYSGNNADGSYARTSDLLQPWGVTVSSVMNVTGLCYGYSASTTASTGTTVRYKHKRGGQGQGSNDNNDEDMKLKKPKPLSKAWIHMNHLDEEDVRNFESATGEFIDALNEAGYVSPFAKGKGPVKNVDKAIKFRVPPGLKVRIPGKPNGMGVAEEDPPEGEEGEGEEGAGDGGGAAENAGEETTE